MRRTTLRRAVAAAAVPTLLAASLTACGSDSGSDSDNSSGDTAADSGEYAEGEEVDKDQFVEDFASALEDATTAHMTMNMNYGTGEPIQAKGQVDYTTDPVSMAMDMSMPMATEGVDMRLVEGVMYMNMGQMTNDKFVKYDLNDPANLPPGMAGLADQMDPLAAFKQFGPALKSVTYVGEEEVDGDDTDHFELVMDTTKVPGLEDLPQGADVPKEMAYDAWFDDDFLIRQMRMTMDMATTMEMEAQFFDWGEPVEIEAPAADDVVEAPPSGTL
jgi:hypothetical protein